MKRIITATWVVEMLDYPGAPERTQQLIERATREYVRLIREVDGNFWANGHKDVLDTQLASLAEFSERRRR